MVLIPERYLIWNEEIHTFEPIGLGRFIHYVRPRVVTKISGKAGRSTSTDDRPGEPKFMTGAEVETWITAHTFDAITPEMSEEFRQTWESGTYGPLDNPRKDQKPKNPNDIGPWPED